MRKFLSTGALFLGLLLFNAQAEDVDPIIEDEGVFYTIKLEEEQEEGELWFRKGLVNALALAPAEKEEDGEELWQINIYFSLTAIGSQPTELFFSSEEKAREFLEELMEMEEEYELMGEDEEDDEEENEENEEEELDEEELEEQ